MDVKRAHRYGDLNKKCIQGGDTTGSKTLYSLHIKLSYQKVNSMQSY